MSATPNKGLSFLLTEFICISSATVTQQGVVCPLTSQLTSCIACLTIIACIPYYTILLDFAFASSGTLVAYIPRWLHPVVQWGFIIGDCSVWQLQRWCWVSCCYPGWLPLTPRYLYVFVSRLTEGVPELLQLGWFMTSSCSCSPWPTQLGVRCGLPVSRNLSGNPTSVEGWTERGGRGKEERRPSGRKMEWQIVGKKRKKKEWGEADESGKLARQRKSAEENGLDCTELNKAWKVWRRHQVLAQEKKCDMWFKTIDLNAPAKLCIDFCWCGESKMFVLFHKPISCKETPLPVCLLTHSLWLQLYCLGGAL